MDPDVAAASFAHARARGKTELSREDQEDAAQDALVDLLEEQARIGVGCPDGFLAVAVGWQAVNTTRRNRRRRQASAQVQDLDGLAGSSGDVPEAVVQRVLAAIPLRLYERLEAVWRKDGAVAPGTLRVWRTRISRWVAENG